MPNKKRKSYRFYCSDCNIVFERSYTPETATEMLRGKMPTCKYCSGSNVERPDSNWHRQQTMGPIHSARDQAGSTVKAFEQEEPELPDDGH